MKKDESLNLLGFKFNEIEFKVIDNTIRIIFGDKERFLTKRSSITIRQILKDMEKLLK